MTQTIPFRSVDPDSYQPPDVARAAAIARAHLCISVCIRGNLLLPLYQREPGLQKSGHRYTRMHTDDSGPTIVCIPSAANFAGYVPGDINV
jgi:hypothetical protein